MNGSRLPQIYDVKQSNPLISESFDSKNPTKEDLEILDEIRDSVEGAIAMEHYQDADNDVASTTRTKKVKLNENFSFNYMKSIQHYLFTKVTNKLGNSCFIGTQKI